MKMKFYSFLLLAQTWAYLLPHPVFESYVVILFVSEIFQQSLNFLILQLMLCLEILQVARQFESQIYSKNHRVHINFFIS